MPENDTPIPAAEEKEFAAACPVCQSEFKCKGGVVRGGEPSAHYQELQTRANSADDYRQRATDLEGELLELRGEEVPAPGAPAEEDCETFL